MPLNVTFLSREKDRLYLEEALALARRARDEGEVPVGAVVVCEEEIIGRGWNQKESLQDPTAHAELIAIAEAAKALRSWRLNRAVLYSTLEPCLMCAGAILHARLARAVYLLPDPKFGAHRSRIAAFDREWNHALIVEQFMDTPLIREVEELMVQFFEGLRGHSRGRCEPPGEGEEPPAVPQGL